MPTPADVPPAEVPPAKVVVATVLRGSGSTGVETHTREALEQFAGAGVRAELVTAFSWLPLLAAAWFAPRRLLDKVAPAAGVVWYRWSHGAALRRGLTRALRHGEPAVVYAQCPVSARAALQARRSPAQAVVLAVHFNVSQADEWAGKGKIRPDGPTFRAIRRLEREVLPNLDGLVYVSEAARADVTGHVPDLDRVPSTIIPNFIRDGARDRAPGLGPAADLVTVGTLEPRKNQVFLLEVLAEAAALGRRFSLDIIGDGSCRSMLARRAEELGVAGDVRFLGNRPDVRAQLPGHRLYVHAARHEAFGIALIEAMSAGLPVLAAPVGGIPEVLDAGRAGTFWSLEDPAEAARTLVALLDDPAALAEAGRAARARFLARYRAEEAGAELARFLTTLAARAKGPGPRISHGSASS